MGWIDRGTTIPYTAGDLIEHAVRHHERLG